MPFQKDPTIPWDKIQADYETGEISLSKLATKYGVSRAGILKRRRADGWDLRKVTNLVTVDPAETDLDTLTDLDDAPIQQVKDRVQRRALAIAERGLHAVAPTMERMTRDIRLHPARYKPRDLLMLANALVRIKELALGDSTPALNNFNGQQGRPAVPSVTIMIGQSPASQLPDRDVATEVTLSGR